MPNLAIFALPFRHDAMGSERMLEHVLASLNRHGARWVYCLAGCGVGRGEKTCARRRGAKDRAHGSSRPQPLATCGPKRGRDQAGDAGRAESATRRLARRRGSALKRFRHSYSLVQQHMFLRSRGAFFAPRFYFLLRAPEFRGWRSAERRSGASERRVGPARNAAGRAPSGALGAPCRGTPASRRSTVAILGSGPALPSPAFAPDPFSELLAARS